MYIIVAINNKKGTKKKKSKLNKREANDVPIFEATTIINPFLKVKCFAEINERVMAVTAVEEPVIAVSTIPIKKHLKVVLVYIYIARSNFFSVTISNELDNKFIPYKKTHNPIKLCMTIVNSKLFKFLTIKYY